MNHAEVLEAVPGLTFHQLDYWTRKGHVRFTVPDRRTPPEHVRPSHRWRYERPAPTSGPGAYRDWPESEIPVLRWMLMLTRRNAKTLGMSVADAERVARQLEDEQLVEIARVGEFCLILQGVRVQVEATA